MFKHGKSIFSTKLDAGSESPVSDLSKAEIAKSFVRIVFAPGGQIKINELRTLVEQYPDESATFARGLVEGEHPDRPTIQRAYTVAYAIAAFHEDDSTKEYLDMRMQELGIADIGELQLVSPDDTQPHDLLIDVSRDIAARCDISTIVESFDNDDALKQYKARCYLAFSYDQDPREVYEIPECRRFIAALHSAMPHFPYLLRPHEMGAFFSYVACLAPLSAIYPNQIDLTERSIAERLVEIAFAVAVTARRLGSNPRETVSALFSYRFDSSFRDALLDALIRQGF